MRPSRERKDPLQEDKEKTVEAGGPVTVQRPRAAAVQLYHHWGGSHELRLRGLASVLLGRHLGDRQRSTQCLRAPVPFPCPTPEGDGKEHWGTSASAFCGWRGRIPEKDLLAPGPQASALPLSPSWESPSSPPTSACEGWSPSDCARPVCSRRLASWGPAEQGPQGHARPGWTAFPRTALKRQAR